MRRAVLYVAFIAGVACGDRPASVTIRIVGASPETPAIAEVVALPFDPQALLDSLALAAQEPAPAFPELEAELRAFQAPPPTDLGAAGRIWAATRDSLVMLGDSLRAVDRRSAGYRAAYGRFRALYQRLAERGAARDAALQTVTGAVRDLARRAGRAADSLRRWEATAYAAFDSLAALAVERTGLEPVHAVPDADGVARLDLGSGAWWIVLTLPQLGNPFVERVWHVPVVSRAGFPFGVPVHESNAAIQWRH